jgi:hypothetical protein
MIEKGLDRLQEGCFWLSQAKDIIDGYRRTE